MFGSGLGPWRSSFFLYFEHAVFELKSYLLFRLLQQHKYAISLTTGDRVQIVRCVSPIMFGV